MIKEGKFSLKDALRMLNPKALLDVPVGGDGIDVSNGNWLESVIRKLRIST